LIVNDGGARLDLVECAEAINQSTSSTTSTREKEGVGTIEPARRSSQAATKQAAKKKREKIEERERNNCVTSAMTIQSEVEEERRR